MIFVDVGVDVNVGDDNDDNDDDDIELFIPNSIKLLFNLVNKSLSGSLPRLLFSFMISPPNSTYLCRVGSLNCWNA